MCVYLFLSHFAKMSHSDVPDLEYVGSGVTFGLGENQRNVSFGFGRGRPMAPGYDECTFNQSVINPPLVPVANSTPAANVNAQPTHVSHNALSSMITDLAKQIGDNITASLSTMHQPSLSQSSPAKGTSPSQLESSHVKVVVQSEARAPPFFRGDHNDTFSIQEWEGMMKCYLSRANCETFEDKYELLMSRLTGKARDVIKVSLRCRPELSGGELITAVFDILKRNFSELTCSNMPMRDFYSTVPRAGEDAMDYWIRLNKSIDAVDECLKRRGKCVEDPNTEVVMMFISHCPDPALCLSFQLKAPEEWTAAEVQQRLDGRVRKMTGLAAKAHAVNSTVTSEGPGQFLFPLSPVPVSSGQMSSLSPSVVAEQIQPSFPAVAHPPTSVFPPTVVPSTAAPDPVAQQMVAMFDKVISLCNASLANGQQRTSRAQVPQRTQHQACQVCSSSDHSTHSHCRLFKLCHNCFGPGHVKRECRQKMRPTASNAPSNADLN